MSLNNQTLKQNENMTHLRTEENPHFLEAPSEKQLHLTPQKAQQDLESPQPLGPATQIHSCRFSSITLAKQVSDLSWPSW